MSKASKNNSTSNGPAAGATTGTATANSTGTASAGTPASVNSPFAALAQLRDALPAAPTGAAPSPAVAVRAKGPARAVVRLEKKGRGGKEATYIEKLELAPKALEDWCKALKQALGCGGVIEGDAIILQGDLRQRLPAVLTARGVRKVVVSGQ
ncbi:MAG: translation initiation factor [Kofleriaceae bacterium]|nr:translation initiation factor [Kofleriaceae bacterium]